LCHLLSAQQRHVLEGSDDANQAAWLIRQDDLCLRTDPDGQAHVLSREFLGYEWLYLIELDGLRLRLRVGLSIDIPAGSRCALSLRADWQPQLIHDSAWEAAAASPPIPAA
jgi:iron(III) transport system ATP-binding protein